MNNKYVVYKKKQINIIIPQLIESVEQEYKNKK